MTKGELHRKLEAEIKTWESRPRGNYRDGRLSAFRETLSFIEDTNVSHKPSMGPSKPSKG